MEEIAEVYARSMFEVARDAGRLDEVRDQLGEVSDEIAGNRELQTFFFSPYFSTEEKYGEKKNTCRSRDPEMASDSWPSCSRTSSSLPSSFATSNRERA